MSHIRRLMCYFLCFVFVSQNDRLGTRACVSPRRGWSAVRPSHGVIIVHEHPHHAAIETASQHESDFQDPGRPWRVWAAAHSRVEGVLGAGDGLRAERGSREASRGAGPDRLCRVTLTAGRAASWSSSAVRHVSPRTWAPSLEAQVSAPRAPVIQGRAGGPASAAASRARPARLRDRRAGYKSAHKPRIWHLTNSLSTSALDL